MKPITLPRLRVALLQAVAETTITICKNIAQVAIDLVGVENVFTPFKEGMLKNKASAEKKSVLDQIRDSRLSGFFSVVFAEEKFDNEDESILNSYAKLLKIATKYGPKIRRLPRDEESAAINNMLADIGQIDITPLISTGIPRWIPKIEAANSAYEDAATEYLSDSVDADAIDAASVLAPELEKALEKLYLTLFASIILSPNDELQKAYAQLEKLVDSMR